MTIDGKFGTLSVRSCLSLLWVLVMFNMIFADIIGLMNPGALEKMLTGDVGFEITQELLLIFSVLLEIPIVMIFLSQVLQRRANQWVNTFAALLTTIFIVGGGSNYLSYLFFAGMEIVFMVAIVWVVWTWPPQEA